MTTGELMARRAAQKLKESHANPELVNMLEAFAEDAEKKRDCPVCGSENPVVESVE